jgi:hypothetical protein
LNLWLRFVVNNLATRVLFSKTTNMKERVVFPISEHDVKVVGGYIHFTLLRSKDTLLMQIRGLFMPYEVLVKPYNSQTILYMCFDEHATSSPAYCLQGL